MIANNLRCTLFTSYDYCNKTNPVTKKINLENIVDVRKFINNNGDEKVLFVDIRGNLHEI